MKPKNILLILCSSLIFCGCIDDYNAKEIDEMGDILVVEGVITDDETIITLSRSTTLTGEEDAYSYYVDNANVYVECDNGTQWSAEPYTGYGYRYGRYIIKNGTLNLNSKYRLKIEIEEVDGDCNPNFQFGGDIVCPTKTYEYCSDFSYPLQTPEIDNIFFIKRDKGQPIMLYVDTRSPEKIQYYRWSYREDWEINSEYNMVPTYPYYCWNSSSSSDLLLGSTEKTVYGQLADILTEIAPSDKRLSVLYRIAIKQNAISKRAYDYYLNIKKNAENIGSIFAPVPSELRGNIICTSDPERPVIGYVDVSSTTKNQRFISRSDNLYEPPWSDCGIFSIENLVAMYGPEVNPILLGYVLYGSDLYVLPKCVDCTYYGTTQKPDDWPNNH